jgi:hypothetical protein
MTGSGRTRAIREGVRKIPEPIVDPTAIIVRSNVERARRNEGGEEPVLAIGGGP